MSPVLVGFFWRPRVFWPLFGLAGESEKLAGEWVGLCLAAGLTKGSDGDYVGFLAKEFAES
jgi:hypothetical protein